MPLGERNSLKPDWREALACARVMRGRPGLGSRDDRGDPMRFARLAALATLALALVAAPLAVEAQPPERVYRIGHLSTLERPAPENLETLRETLRSLGWVEGKNITIENKLAGRNPERLAAFAADLVRMPVDLIVVTGAAEAARVAKSATKTIPIVFVLADDPVRMRLITSLSRPEANITGISSMNVELDAKRLTLLKEMLPQLRHVGVLWSPVDPSGAAVVRATEVAASSSEVQLQALQVRSAQDLGDALGTAKKGGAGAIMVLGSPTLYEYQDRIAELAMKARLPTISPWRKLPESGGLMSYGTDVAEMFRRAAIYVDKILRGAKPGDLPVEQPTKFDLVINLKTAKALGLTIPPSVLARADEVIQ